MNIRKLFSGQLLLSLRNAGWMFFDRIFRMATSLLVGVWLARYLGPEQYGLLNYAYVFPLTLAALVSLGINTILISEIPTITDSVEADRLVLTSIVLKITAGLVAFGLIIAANYYLHNQSPQLLVLVSISASMLLFQGLDTVDIYFQSVRRVQYSIIPKIVSFGLATLARLYGLTQGLTLYFFVIVMVAEVALSYLTIYALYLRQRQLPSLLFSFHKATAKRILRAAWPIMLAEFFIFIYTRLDQVMIKQFSNSVELGKYSAALRLSEAWYFVAGALTASFYPSIIALRSTNYMAYLRRYQYLLNLLVGLGFGIGLIITFSAEQVAQLLYGSQYEGVGAILSIHIWTGLFVFLALGTNNWFIVEKMQTFLLGRTIAGAVTNVALNIFLIPRYGAMGASVATLLAQLGAAYLTNGFYRRTKEVFQLQTNALLFIPRWSLSAFRRALLNLKAQ